LLAIRAAVGTMTLKNREQLFAVFGVPTGCSFYQPQYCCETGRRNALSRSGVLIVALSISTGLAGSTVCACG
jgi:hypothetical protein